MHTGMVEKFGYHRDEADARDHAFVPDPQHAAALPAHVDLSSSPYEPPIYDQKPLASCSAHAIGAMLAFVCAKEGRGPLTPSRLFIYFNERKLENTIPKDCGAQIRDGMKSIATFGVCDEAHWGYDAAKFADLPPQDPCYTNALQYRAINYFRILGGLPALKACLAAGYPFVFGMSVYSNLSTPQVAQTGVATLPGADDTLLGGHAVTAVGYDDAQQTFRIRNSAGTGWGMKGYFTLPYTFLESSHLADDFWTLRSLT
ncbi:MAG: C1 family peptidase [Vulcanimicrobiaceae bacterium]